MMPRRRPPALTFLEEIIIHLFFFLFTYPRIKKRRFWRVIKSHRRGFLLGSVSFFFLFLSFRSIYNFS